MRQRGVALIVVLLLLSMAVLIGAQIIESLDASRVRTENALLAEQGHAYLLSAEALALRALQADLEEDRRANQLVDDCSEEAWALAMGPIPWDNGLFSVSIQDLQGRLNLNDLAPTREEERVANRVQVERLKRLLRAVMPAPEAADLLAEEAVDWTDGNALVDGLGGAEDTEYPAWRTANLPFAHPSELRALRSAAADWFAGSDAYPDFTRYIAALPEGVRVNVNTAPVEVLSALVEGLDGAGGQALADARAGQPFVSVDEFLAMPAVAGLPEAARRELKDAVVVASEYFQVVSQVQVGDRTARMVSIVYRPLQGGSPVVVQRDLGAAFLAPEPPCNPGATPDAEQEQE